MWHSPCYGTHTIFVERSTATNVTVHNNRSNKLDEAIKKAYLTEAAIHNIHTLYSAFVEKLLKYADLKEELRSIWQPKAVCILPLVLSTKCIIPDNLYDSSKLPNLSYGLKISQVESSNTQYMTYNSNVFSRVMNKKCLVSDPYALKSC